MFAVEIGAAVVAGSASLLADAIDFFGDAANYSVSLFVIGMALHARATAALVKGATMAIFGAWVLATATWHAVQGNIPDAVTMGTVGAVALLVNIVCLGLLWAFRRGDSNMRSVWLCSRNDVLGNLAVLLAAAGVFGTSAGWPDIVVAAIMGGLALQGSWVVMQQAGRELRASKRRNSGTVESTGRERMT
jgi:Co/Zn/Cd efflux system component